VVILFQKSSKHLYCFHSYMVNQFPFLVGYGVHYTQCEDAKTDSVLVV